MAQLEDLEETYRNKIAAEVDRYDAMIAQRDASNQAWDKENAAIIAAHERHVAKLKKLHEDFLAEEEVRAPLCVAGFCDLACDFGSLIPHVWTAWRV